MTIMLAFAWRASLMAVARDGITVSGNRSCWYASSRSSLETTIRPGLLRSSAKASAKLSPTQLYSARFEVFSKGRTITTSAAGFCAWAGENPAKTVVNTRMKLNLRLKNLMPQLYQAKPSLAKAQRRKESRKFLCVFAPLREKNRYIG